MPLTQNDLSGFTGDLTRYRHPLHRKLVFTPGVHHLAEHGQAFWMIDVVASYLSDIASGKHGEDMQYLSFFRFDFSGDSGCIITVGDGNDDANGERNVMIRQDVPFTDFRSRSDIEVVQIWLGVSDADGEGNPTMYTAYLPSEH